MVCLFLFPTKCCMTRYVFGVCMLYLMDKLNSNYSQLASSKTIISLLINVNDTGIIIILFLLQKMKVVLLALVLSFAAVAYCQDAACLATAFLNSGVQDCATQIAVSLVC